MDAYEKNVAHKHQEKADNINNPRSELSGKNIVHTVSISA
jgi:hypothetical protein